MPAVAAAGILCHLWGRADVNEIIKVCTGCNEAKPLDDFSLNKLGAYGRNSRCRSCKSAAARAKYADNPVPQLEAQRARYWSDPEAAREYNRDKMRRRYADNPEAVRAAARKGAQKRRAVKAGATIGDVNEAEVMASASDCYLCGKPLAGPIQLDHIIPLARGGAHCLDNLAPTHKACNNRKSVLLLSELNWYSGPLGIGVASSTDLR